jgi:hypothetical protein
MKTEDQQRAERMLQNPLANRDVPEPAAADRSRADSNRSIVHDHRSGVTPRAVRPGRDISDGGDCD